MKKHIIILALAAVSVIMPACEKEIDIGYASVEPIYVIEGYVGDTGIEVLLTSTKDMENGSAGSPVPDADVKISDGKGFEETLAYSPDGRYHSAYLSTGSPGNTYTLTVNTGDKEFVSTSELVEPGQMVGIEVVFDAALTERWMFCTLVIQDHAPGDTRYCLRIFKNGELYSRRLLTDKGFDQGLLQDRFAFRFSMSPTPTPDEIKSGNAEKMFRKGDILALVLETIDRPVYDYLYSLGLTGTTLSNPLTNIEGGCLGYFRAFSSDSYSTVFDPEAIKDQMPGSN